MNSWSYRRIQFSCSCDIHQTCFWHVGRQQNWEKKSNKNCNATEAFNDRVDDSEARQTMSAIKWRNWKLFGVLFFVWNWNWFLACDRARSCLLSIYVLDARFCLLHWKALKLKAEQLSLSDVITIAIFGFLFFSIALPLCWALSLSVYNFNSNFFS